MTAQLLEILAITAMSVLKHRLARVKRLVFTRDGGDGGTQIQQIDRRVLARACEQVKTRIFDSTIFVTPGHHGTCRAAHP
ncbi:MAG: hypothetical protein WBF88_06800 [Pusillimonas sp.]